MYLFVQEVIMFTSIILNGSIESTAFHNQMLVHRYLAGLVIKWDMTRDIHALTGYSISCLTTATALRSTIM